MSAPLAEKLSAARAEVARLEREAEQATCAEIGHDWKLLGGRNAGCGAECCSCSVPVHECARCKDCDYGENDEAEKIMTDCGEGA